MDGESLFAASSRTKILVEYYGPSIAEGIIEDALKYHLSYAPAFFLDVPTYQAIRTKKTIVDNGKPIEKTYLFVRWERPLDQRFFRKRLRKGRTWLASRIRRERPLALSRLERLDEYDRELYDISSDPYQLKNVLAEVSHPFGNLANELETEMDRLRNCKGSTGPSSCIEASKDEIRGVLAAPHRK
jgi:hypothetical protein